MVNPTKENLGPPWLKPMLKARYFRGCSIHTNENKNEGNIFCLDCMGDPLCTFCSVLHKDHRILQIRRSSYHDVVRVDEIENYVDISMVQTYVINSAKIVFLNERPLSRPAKGHTIHCQICFRALPDPSFHYCSLRCKLNGIKKGASDLTFSLKENNNESGLDGELPPPTKKIRTSSSSVSSENPSSTRNVVAPPKNPNSRKRKGIPRRAPFF